MILRPSSRMLEGVIDGKPNIGVALIRRRRGAPDADFARRTFGRPFICFGDVRGIVHRPVRDRLKGLAMAVSNTNGGMDLQPFRAEVTAVG
jgi:hypothetical protein